MWVPDAAHEALRDLVRAREAAKKDQLRARHRLGKFLLRHGRRPTEAGKAWTKKYLEWIKTHVRFDQPALEATLAHYLQEVDHAAEQILKLEKAIDEAVAQASPEIRSVIEALQALRGVAQMTAATIVCELGSLSRFQSPRQLMGYSGLVSREYSSGNRIQRGAITKTGNALARTCLVEAAWTYRFPARVTQIIRDRLNGLPEPIRNVALEGAGAAFGAISQADRRRQAGTQGGRGNRTRIGRLHLGDCPNGRTEIRLIRALTKRAWQSRR